MTDEEARKIAMSVVGYAYDVSEFNVELVKEGYRAALADVHDQFVTIRRKKSAADACEEYGDWLQAQVKKEGV